MAIKPWISGDIKFCANIKKWQNYYSLLKENKISLQLYEGFRNFVTNEIKRTKINYFSPQV